MDSRPVIAVFPTLVLIVQIAAIIYMIYAVWVVRVSGKRVDAQLKKASEYGRKIDELLAKMKGGRMASKAVDSNKNIAGRFTNELTRLVRLFGLNEVTVNPVPHPDWGYTVQVSQGSHVLLSVAIGRGTSREHIILRRMGATGEDVWTDSDDESIEKAFEILRLHIQELALASKK